MPQQNSNDVDEGKILSRCSNKSDESGNRLQSRLRQGKMEKKSKRHPLKMPLRTDPVSNRIICRFHNYDARSGCKKFNHCCKNSNSGEENVCPLDHETCHVCLEKGHPAHQCNHFDNLSSDVWKEFCSLTLKNTRPDDYPTNKTVLGDSIVWIGDTTTISASSSSLSSTTINNVFDGRDNNDFTTETKFLVTPPKIPGFKVGEDDQLGRCRRQKKIEAAYMLELGHGSVVVDAGAHLGDSILTLAIHARAKNRRDLRFVALEPCPEKCDFLRSVVAANNLLEAVIIKCAAVGDTIGVVQPASNAKERAKRDGSLRYEYCHGCERSNVVTDGANGAACKHHNSDDDVQYTKTKEMISDSSKSRGDTARTITPIITLDSIIDQISPLGMLHIDVEGWESNVLRGAKKSLTTIPECNNRNVNCHFPCFVIAEAWTKKESLRRGVPGNAEEKIVRVMEDEVNTKGGDAQFLFERMDDIVDIERNLVYIRKRKGKG